MKAKNTGINVPAPEKLVQDRNCPFTGTARLRGRTFVGRVISDRMAKTCTVEFSSRRLNKKYERYEQIRTRLKAHNPPSIAAKTGDLVKLAETRPLSKTKHFIIIQVLGE
ncbi:MAG: 30S ribosomal protein S17 [archaeon]